MDVIRQWAQFFIRALTPFSGGTVSVAAVHKVLSFWNAVNDARTQSILVSKLRDTFETTHTTWSTELDTVVRINITILNHPHFTAAWLRIAVQASITAVSTFRNAIAALGSAPLADVVAAYHTLPGADVRTLRLAPLTIDNNKRKRNVDETKEPDTAPQYVTVPQIAMGDVIPSSRLDRVVPRPALDTPADTELAKDWARESATRRGAAGNGVQWTTLMTWWAMQALEAARRVRAVQDGTYTGRTPWTTHTHDTWVFTEPLLSLKRGDYVPGRWFTNQGVLLEQEVLHSRFLGTLSEYFRTRPLQLPRFVVAVAHVALTAAECYDPMQPNLKTDKASHFVALRLNLKRRTVDILDSMLLRSVRVDETKDSAGAAVAKWLEQSHTLQDLWGLEPGDLDRCARGTLERAPPDTVVGVNASGALATTLGHMACTLEQAMDFRQGMAFVFHQLLHTRLSEAQQLEAVRDVRGMASWPLRIIGTEVVPQQGDAVSCGLFALATVGYPQSTDDHKAAEARTHPWSCAMLQRTVRDELIRWIDGYIAVQAQVSDTDVAAPVLAWYNQSPFLPKTRAATVPPPPPPLRPPSSNKTPAASPSPPPSSTASAPGPSAGNMVFRYPAPAPLPARVAATDPSGTTDKAYHDLATRLITQGVVVVPVLSAAEVEYFRSQIEEAVGTFPEYQSPSVSGHDPLVLGGFGAFGNPSSFHAPVFRELRRRMCTPAIRLLHAFCTQLGLAQGTTTGAAAATGDDDRKGATGKVYMQQLLDRFSIRRKGMALSAESWHRDESPIRDNNDIVFGGWVNLDPAGTVDQILSCVPRTHNMRSEGGGFSKIQDELEVALYRRTCKSMAVPSGHWIIFFQNLVHEVAKRSVPFDSWRMYSGFRISTTDSDLWSQMQRMQVKVKPMARRSGKAVLYDLDQVLTDQGIPAIPSGQFPPVMSSNHETAFATKKFLQYPGGAVQWSRTVFKPQTFRGSDSAHPDLVHRFMKSLRDYGFPLYAEYSAEDRRWLMPQELTDAATRLLKSYEDEKHQAAAAAGLDPEEEGEEEEEEEKELPPLPAEDEGDEGDEGDTEPKREGGSLKIGTRVRIGDSHSPKNAVYTTPESKDPGHESIVLVADPDVGTWHWAVASLGDATDEESALMAWSEASVGMEGGVWELATDMGIHCSGDMGMMIDDQYPDDGQTPLDSEESFQNEMSGKLVVGMRGHPDRVASVYWVYLRRNLFNKVDGMRLSVTPLKDGRRYAVQEATSSFAPMSWTSNTVQVGTALGDRLQKSKTVKTPSTAIVTNVRSGAWTASLLLVEGPNDEEPEEKEAGGEAVLLVRVKGIYMWHTGSSPAGGLWQGRQQVLLPADRSCLCVMDTVGHEEWLTRGVFPDADPEEPDAPEFVHAPELGERGVCAFVDQDTVLTTSGGDVILYDVLVRLDEKDQRINGIRIVPTVDTLWADGVRTMSELVPLVVDLEYERALALQIQDVERLRALEEQRFTVGDFSIHSGLAMEFPTSRTEFTPAEVGPWCVRRVPQREVRVCSLVHHSQLGEWHLRSDLRDHMRATRRVVLVDVGVRPVASTHTRKLPAYTASPLLITQSGEADMTLDDADLAYGMVLPLVDFVPHSVWLRYSAQDPSLLTGIWISVQASPEFPNWDMDKQTSRMDVLADYQGFPAPLTTVWLSPDMAKGTEQGLEDDKARDAVRVAWAALVNSYLLRNATAEERATVVKRRAAVRKLMSEDGKGTEEDDEDMPEHLRAESDNALCATRIVRLVDILPLIDRSDLELRAPPDPAAAASMPRRVYRWKWMERTLFAENLLRDFGQPAPLEVQMLSRPGGWNTVNLTNDNIRLVMAAQRAGFTHIYAVTALFWDESPAEDLAESRPWLTPDGKDRIPEAFPAFDGKGTVPFGKREYVTNDPEFETPDIVGMPSKPPNAQVMTIFHTSQFTAQYPWMSAEPVTDALLTKLVTDYARVADYRARYADVLDFLTRPK